MSDEGFKRSFRNMGLQRGEWEEPKMTKTPDDAAAEERESYRRWYENQYPDRAEAARLRDENKRLRAALQRIATLRVSVDGIPTNAEPWLRSEARDALLIDAPRLVES